MNGIMPYILILIGIWLFVIGLTGRLGDVLAAVVAPDEMTIVTSA